MRPIERIDIFLTLVNLKNYLFDIGYTSDKHVSKLFVRAIEENLGEIRKFWKEHPDLRFTQVLVNLCIIPNTPGTWYYMEEDDLLLKQGIPARDCLLWGSNFNKRGKRLKKTKYKLIKDLSTNHIINIMQEGHTSNYKYVNAFNAELKRRAKPRKFLWFKF